MKYLKTRVFEENLLSLFSLSKFFERRREKRQIKRRSEIFPKVLRGAQRKLLDEKLHRQKLEQGVEMKEKLCAKTKTKVSLVP